MSDVLAFVSCLNYDRKRKILFIFYAGKAGVAWEKFFHGTLSLTVVSFVSLHNFAWFWYHFSGSFTIFVGSYIIVI